MHNNIRVIRRRLIPRSPPPNPANILRAFIQNVSDGDGEVATTTIEKCQLGHLISSLLSVQDRTTQELKLNSPISTSLPPARTPNSNSHDRRSADLAEGFGEAADYAAGFAGAERELVGAGGEGAWVGQGAGAVGVGGEGGGEGCG